MGRSAFHNSALSDSVALQMRVSRLVPYFQKQQPMAMPEAQRGRVSHCSKHVLQSV